MRHLAIALPLVTLVAGMLLVGPARAADSSVKRGSPFACNRAALTPEARTRHFEVLGPALRSKATAIRELPDGYEFQFAPDTATFRMLAEWADGERRCCPFFDIAVRFEREGGPLALRLTGREGTKQFIRADLAKWFAASHLRGEQ